MTLKLKEYDIEFKKYEEGFSIIVNGEVMSECLSEEDVRNITVNELEEICKLTK